MRMKSRLITLLIVLVSLSICSAEPLQKKGRRTATQKGSARTSQSRLSSNSAARANYGKYEFTLATLDGKTIRLSDYAGKVVLVNIWGPWCAPCRVETPGFVKLYNQYKSKGFEIIGVAVKTNEGDVRAFMQKYNVSWPVGIKDDIARAFGTYGLPDSYLFRVDGSLAKRFIGFTKAEALTPLVEEALKQVNSR